MKVFFISTSTCILKTNVNIFSSKLSAAFYYFDKFVTHSIAKQLTDTAISTELHLSTIYSQFHLLYLLLTECYKLISVSRRY